MSIGQHISQERMARVGYPANQFRYCGFCDSSFPWPFHAAEGSSELCISPLELSQINRHFYENVSNSIFSPLNEQLFIRATIQYISDLRHMVQFRQFRI